jgi:hypothetical protein
MRRARPARIRRGNVARLAAALAALALVVAWPRLQAAPPALPDDRAIPVATVDEEPAEIAEDGGAARVEATELAQERAVPGERAGGKADDARRRARARTSARRGGRAGAGRARARRGGRAGAGRARAPRGGRAGAGRARARRGGRRANRAGGGRDRNGAAARTRRRKRAAQPAPPPAVAPPTRPATGPAPVRSAAPSKPEFGFEG